MDTPVNQMVGETNSPTEAQDDRSGSEPCMSRAAPSNSCQTANETDAVIKPDARDENVVHELPRETTC